MKELKNKKMKILAGLTMAIGLISGISSGIQASPLSGSFASRDTSIVASGEGAISLKADSDQGECMGISPKDSLNESTITVSRKGNKKIVIINKKNKAYQGKTDSNIFIKDGDKSFAIVNGKILNPVNGKTIDLASLDNWNFSDLNNLKELNEVHQIPGIDTTKIRVGKKSYIFIEKGDGSKEYRMSKKQSLFFYPMLNSFYIGFNGFAKSNYDQYAVKDFMDVKFATSLEVGFYFIQGGIRLIGHTLGLVSGVGMSFNDYRFKNDYTIYKDPATGIIAPKFLDSAHYPSLDKTKLSVSYLDVPLLLQLNMPTPGKTFYLLGGVEGGLNMGGHTKIKYGSGTKDKDHGDLDINPFKATALVRAGTSDFQVYAKYNMTKLFENGKGPELTPLSFGICLVFQ